MIYYYSGCGNSRWIANEIAQSTQDKLLFIPEISETEQSIEGQSIGFVFPIYSWAAPQVVEDFILKTQWSGTPKYVWFACTCGDEMGKTFDTFTKTLKKVGLTLNAGFCFQMPETYLCFPGFHLDSKENEQAKIDAARTKLPSVIENIKAYRQIRDEIVGSFPRFKSFVIRPGFIKNVTDKKYHTTDACTGCGLCATKCPFHNIEIKNGKPEWQGHCTQCMACYHYCPQNAIHFATYTQNKGQYYCKEK